jgi:2-polyprenyl-3-methyl-5-hydroxy-6-metoxy-1,4-benzoquinol methylase
MHPTGNAPNPALVFETINAFQRTAALRAAVDLELFAAIGEGHSNVADLARRCACTPRGIRILCDYLTVVGLIAKDGESYRHTPTSAAFLDPKSPSCIAATVRFLNKPEIMGHYDHLTQVIREGYGALGQGTVEPENPAWVDFAHSMAPMMAPMAAPLGEVVLRGGGGPMRVLDIAAGHGLFGIEVARQNPQARVTALDWAAVLEVARANAAKAGVLERYELKPGSAFDVDFGGPHDIVLLTNFLHHFDPPTCEDLLRKCRAALVPGGRVAALEFVPNPDRVSPPMPAAFALIMLASTPAGDSYTYPEYQRMFQNAGLTDLDIHPVANAPHHIVVGHAPA